MKLIIHSLFVFVFTADFVMAKGKKFTITFDKDLKTGVIEGEDGNRTTRNVTGEP